ncbi:hypothetical protein G6F70_004739 [Rhizopus microsporus]|uniref:DH domain-containing protein n=2 Tax=Rhizopus TaxID=4842 RepID=A0A367KD25_RHIAZ|nr:hypothetical protein G6F71_004755 [Rhizopus microsporus]RCH99999.1 hypothetical protein CU097_012782 [Rhizopus azygosporus]KAG1199655.1 hypothetical protein G6F70_004739 [Rhizopus microsporus]KAG1211414.1 hypothetical protein G6F69_004620 [Rhizopus microsporus]KAG1233292.1 hypothetical protein G6F67_004383 [Rhizopus microsporus]
MNRSKSSNEPSRPALSINTKNISRRKRWSGLISAKEKIKSDLQRISSFGQTEEFVSSPESECSVVAQTQPTYRLKSSDTMTSQESSSTNGSAKKKFSFPHFRRHSGLTEKSTYVPEVPEPIMPPLIASSPDEVLSPPPWEAEDINRKRHSLSAAKLYSFTYHEEEEEEEELPDTEEDEEYHSDPELLNNNSNLSSISSDVTLHPASIGNRHSLRRRSSCPSYDAISLSSSSSTMVEKDILYVTEQHTRNMLLLKKNRPVDKKVTFKPCQKVIARAAEAAANGDTVSGPMFLPFCEETLRYTHIPNVFDPDTREPVLQFTNIKPREYQLRRKMNWKKEAKALMTWHDTLQVLLNQPSAIHSRIQQMTPEKREKYQLTRKFILREFYTTEVNFWNQLYYTKIVFYDALVDVVGRENRYAQLNGADVFANLFDLMRFSAKLIHRLRHLQLDKRATTDSPKIIYPFNAMPPLVECCHGGQLGKILCDMSEDMVVFLRCAIDYRENRKLLQNKMYENYRQRLYSKKETSQFSMEDFLIIPIQRVARYGLLLADLIRHTDPSIPDYVYLIKAHRVITSLATAMNSVQKKSK